MIQMLVTLLMKFMSKDTKLSKILAASQDLVDTVRLAGADDEWSNVEMRVIASKAKALYQAAEGK
jgi:hypothetical protein